MDAVKIIAAAPTFHFFHKLALAIAVWLGVIAFFSLAANTASGQSQTGLEKRAAAREIKSSTPSGRRARILVLVDSSKPDSATRNSRSQNAINNVLGQLTPGRFKLKRQSTALHLLALEVETSELDKFVAIPSVRAIEPDRLFKPSLSSSVPIIGAPEAWALGYAGNGQFVAILDTGVDRSHPLLGSGAKIVAEACFSSNTPEPYRSVSACANAQEATTGPGAAAPCAIASDCWHGTHVTSVAVGIDEFGGDRGVAPDANAVAIQVFSNFYSSELCAPAPSCALSYTSDLLAAMEHVLSLKESLNIAAVNLSLGDSINASANCDSENLIFKSAVDTLRAAGVATIASSGNNGYRNGIVSPACISSVISVGATGDSDTIASFSNVSSNLDLLAPGVAITAAFPGGGKYSASGTSFSSPMVAGAWAILREAFPEDNINQTLSRLRDSGTLINDQRVSGSAIDLPRINLDLALTGEAPQPQHQRSGYIALRGCRVLDTRNDGAIAAGVIAPITLATGSLSNLEHVLGCEVPGDLLWVHVNVTVIAKRSSAGYLRLWAGGDTEPRATVAAWNKDSNVANAMQIGVCDDASCNSDLSLKYYTQGGDSVDIVIDLLGYHPNDR